MRRRRGTIAGAMGLVALTAIGLAGLRHPTVLATSIVFSLTVVTIFVAAVAAISYRGRRRATWGSFAACGSGYLLLAIGPWSEPKVGPHFFTIFLIEASWNHLVDHSEIGAVYFGKTHDFFDRFHFYDASPWSCFHRVAHSLLSIGAATTGALCSLYLTRKPNSKSPDHP